MNVIKNSFELFKKLCNLISFLGIIIAAILLASIMSIGILQVFCRYILNSSLQWAEEIMRYMLIWLVFIILPIAINKKKHISLEIIPQKWAIINKFLNILVNLSALVILLTIFYKSLDFIDIMRFRTAITLPISMSYIFIIVPISLIIAILQYIKLLLENISEEWRHIS